jgi:hypothetical protein
MGWEDVFVIIPGERVVVLELKERLGKSAKVFAFCCGFEELCIALPGLLSRFNILEPRLDVLLEVELFRESLLITSGASLS